MPRKPARPFWVDLEGPGEEETEEEKTLPPNQQSAKARRKREADATRAQGYQSEPVAADKKCGAKRADGSRCGQVAGWGTDHTGYGPCKWHMGSTPMGRKAAATEMADELMWFYGKPIDTNPIEALLDEVNRTAGHIDWIGRRIAQFNVPLEEEVDGQGGIKIKRPTGVPPEVEGWLKMYQSERNQLIRASKAALDAGVNERLVQLAEHQGAKLADAVEEILSRLGLTPNQWALVPDVVPNVLRQLMGTPKLIEGVTVDDVPGA